MVNKSDILDEKILTEIIVYGFITLHFMIHFAK